MSSNLILYSYFRSSCSWRVRIALHYKNLAFDTHPVHLVKDGGEQHADSYATLNPMSQVPALKVGTSTLTQSMAILEYLEEKHPTPPLLPTAPLNRAKVRQMAEMVNSGIQPLQNLAVMQSLRQSYQLEQNATQDWSALWVVRGLIALEKTVSEYGGDFCFENAVSLADLCLVPQLYNARRFGVVLSTFPKLTNIESRLSTLPAFINAHPDNQPDAPQ